MKIQLECTRCGAPADVSTELGLHVTCDCRAPLVTAEERPKMVDNALAAVNALRRPDEVALFVVRLIAEVLDDPEVVRAVKQMLEPHQKH